MHGEWTGHVDGEVRWALLDSLRALLLGVLDERQQRTALSERLEEEQPQSNQSRDHTRDANYGAHRGDVGWRAPLRS